MLNWFLAIGATFIGVQAAIFGWAYLLGYKTGQAKGGYRIVHIDMQGRETRPEQKVKTLQDVIEAVGKSAVMVKPETKH